MKRMLIIALLISLSLPAAAQKKRTAAGDPDRIEARGILPNLSDDELLDEVQRQTFRYFWDFAHPISGMARERSNRAYHYGEEVVTTGGTGFGVMATVVAVHRGWITRDSAARQIGRASCRERV